MSICRIRDFASSTIARNPSLCALACPLMIVVDSSNLCTEPGKFALYVLIAAVDVIDAVDSGFAFRYQSGENQGCTGTQIGCDYLSSGECSGTSHDGLSSIQPDAGS